MKSFRVLLGGDHAGTGVGIEEGGRDSSLQALYVRTSFFTLYIVFSLYLGFLVMGSLCRIEGCRKVTHAEVNDRYASNSAAEESHAA
eukprot:CAMPEP_0172527704 /NCGR_PEP_ID=MMETSP1067-20121228/2326_1 /TAXON_ID=265564 ORGANISM="Thalassiosira punctigera, Strain Tpunct2005C2" /NCGR_SAMPLE_ID=MMETSP1067 /ASSEMBLY_ACC=CAM_ASM_000444 /LENGTH=86 /DNA_ID=CAMNT_0013311497 /DNA_START=88 /DNA_END=349 /DNA_ORIENTATION=-